MIPILQARTRYGDDFEKNLEWFYEYGYVYSAPDLFFMACRHDKEFLLGNKNKLDISDCWYIHYIVGNIKRVFEICPEPLEWVVFQRWGSDKYKCYNFNKLKERVNGTKRTP